MDKGNGICEQYGTMKEYGICRNVTGLYSVHIYSVVLVLGDNATSRIHMKSSEMQDEAIVVQVECCVPAHYKLL